MKYILPICMAIFLFSCNTTDTQNSKTSTGKTSAVHCYQYIKNRDTIMLKTISAGDFITGLLVYNIYQKDKNMGTIEGSMEGDLLVADYSFNSEGVNSVRQVVFRKLGKAFEEGTGEIKEYNNKIIFKNIDSLYFNDSIVLKEFRCESITHVTNKP